MSGDDKQERATKHGEKMLQIEMCFAIAAEDFKNHMDKYRCKNLFESSLL